MAEAARRLPHAPFLVYSQTNDLPPMPGNVEVRPAMNSNEDLYRDGDVCIQPSRWEGLGLPLLECQAAGMPMITIDAPPMNEHHPFRLIPVGNVETVPVPPSHQILVPSVSGGDVAAVAGAVYQRNIEGESYQSRAYIERMHSWQTARIRIMTLLESWCPQQRDDTP